jgi:hypothetical protein
MPIKEEDIKSYIIFDHPVPYISHHEQKVPLKIRCPLVKEYLEFNLYSSILDTERDDPSFWASLEDEQLVKDMDTLSFFFYLSINKKVEKTTERQHIYLLDKLLKLVCDLPQMKEVTTETGETREVAYITYGMDEETDKAFLLIDDAKYTGEDIDNILDIIKIQNHVSGVDYTKTKELRDALSQAMRYRAKQSGSKMADLENQITALAVVTGWTIEYIHGLSIRKYNQAIERADKLETWRIYSTAANSGLVKFPANFKPLEHWLTDLSDKDKYAGSMTSLDSLNQKIGGQEAMSKVQQMNDKFKNK